ncbi:MAG: hypothetical protein CMM74_13825 [Rhodospirillaceae bacterium]|nr:hypothetical protein [Rhodospirillaceae bacterium]
MEDRIDGGGGAYLLYAFDIDRLACRGSLRYGVPSRRVQNRTGAPPSLLPKSGYLDLCNEEKTLLVRWKDEGLLGKSKGKRNNTNSPLPSPR